MNRGIVYQIYYDHPDHGMIRYIGSTSQSLKQRYLSHVSTYERWCEGRGPNVSLYPFWFRYGIDRFTVEEIICIRYDSLSDLRKEEQHYLSTMDNINTLRAYNTDADRRVLAQRYYSRNRDSIMAHMRSKAVQRITCPCGMEHSYGGKTSHLRTKKHAERMQLIYDTNNNSDNISSSQ